MTNFPTTYDDDGSIYRISDDITELGSDAINQLRSAVFSVELNLGLTAAGSLSTLSDRLNISINPDGTIKASALTSIGLITLPVTNAQIGVNAGILESKLALNFSTSSLNTLIQANSVLLASLSAFEAALEIKVNSHIAGGPSAALRHTASMIDLNAVPSDSRDPSYIWSGLIDKDGYALTAVNVADGLNQINTNLTGHQNQIKDAHAASAISVDASNFSELLTSNESVQDVLDNIDDIELLQLGTHRATQHTNGIPKAARSLNLSSATTLGSDGYNLQVLDPTPCETFVVHNPPGNAPIDNVNVGDSIVTFKPTTNVGSVFDAKFSQVKIGDIIRINYGTVQDIRRVESIRYVPGAEWVVRINGVNLVDSDGYGAVARIDRPLYDSNIYGVLAVGAANAVPLTDYDILGSVIIGDPRGAVALGMNFDGDKLCSTNYNLYLELYPTGNPADHVIKLPPIDVTGNVGQTQGKYTLENTVTNCNNAFRATGFNYRFIAFSVNGNFGIMLADSIDGASFAIINGSNSTGSLTESTYVFNVVGDVYGKHFDGLGFGVENINLASPAYQASWLDATAAQFPTKIIHPVKSRNYIVNGRPFDQFKSKELTTNGFWAGDIDARNVTGSSVEVTYKINSVLETAGLKPGKTILIQPAVAYSDPLYSDVDYGRFIIKSVVFNNCHCVNDYTLITVINGIHGTANPLSASGGVNLPVRIYFDEGSVSFDDQNIIDSSDTNLNYHRLHEIYINDAKTTFSHERARVAYVTETSQLIDSTSWHITGVSSKFRGYRDTSGSAFNKYIRLFIKNYNTVSGEFDGYLGQRDLSSPIMQHIGQITRGRKNVPVKFYDDTNVDFIELIFRDESSASPGLILVANKWIDVELFDSLILDQELLPLATCEVNWKPLFGKNCIEYVRNAKQYGSISELEFTQSAVDFITAGEKYLHQNGIIYGFDTDIDALNLKFLIHGGIALVNGKIITTNNLFVKLPVVTNTIVPPQNINWVVCINDNGDLESFPLTDTKTQFFARDEGSGQNYYIPSYSFIELTNKKNLVALYIINVNITTTIAPIAITGFSDVRKFIKNETSLIPLTWIGRDVNDSDANINTSELSGHFNNFDQVKNWINWTKSTNNVIKVKGNIVSNSMIDVSLINYPTIFDGENGCIFNLNSPRGIKFGSNITFKNISFNWSPGALTYTAGDNVNLDTDGTPGVDDSNGCLYSIVNDGYTINNILIDNCNFTGIFPQTQRPPYITMVFGGDSTIFDNIKISRNKFNDPDGINNQCAIVIALLGIESLGQTAMLSNTIINDNIANNHQGILITTLLTPTIKLGILNCRNTYIQKNIAGFIGYMVGANVENTPDTSDPYGLDGLNILENTVLFIGSLDSTGHILNSNNTDFGFAGSGSIEISHNYCTAIYCNFYPDLINNSVKDLLISKNKLKAKDYTEIFNIFGLTNANFNFYCGIYIDGRYDQIDGADIGQDNRVLQMLDNTLSYYVDRDTSIRHTYQVGIYNDSCAGIISGNILRDFTNSGIVIDNNVVRSNFVNIAIINNQLYNTINTAQPYIGIDNQISPQTINYKIVNNAFDKHSTNGSSSFMITIGGVDNNKYVIKDNINQTDSINLRASTFGKIVIPTTIDTNNLYTDPLSNLFNGDTTSENINFLRYAKNNQFDSDSDPFGQFGQLSISFSAGGKLSWVIPLTLLNKNVKFVSAEISYRITSTASGSSEIKLMTLSLNSESSLGDSVVLTETIPSTSSSDSGTLHLILTDPNNPIDISSGYYISIDCSLDAGATANAVIYLSTLIITYRY